jgi:hypothetical protein
LPHVLGQVLVFLLTVEPLQHFLPARVIAKMECFEGGSHERDLLLLGCQLGALELPDRHVRDEEIEHRAIDQVAMFAGEGHLQRLQHQLVLLRVVIIDVLLVVIIAVAETHVPLLANRQVHKRNLALHDADRPRRVSLTHVCGALRNFLMQVLDSFKTALPRPQHRFPYLTVKATSPDNDLRLDQDLLRRLHQTLVLP